MRTNRGFTTHDDDRIEEMKNDETQTKDLDVENGRPMSVLSDPYEDDNSPCCCCSWTKMCEVLGNRQGKFISTLRPLRGPLVYALQALKRFELELERNIKSEDSAEDTSQKVTNVINCINALTTHTKLNIPPEENQVLRAVANELVILQRVIDEVAYSIRLTSTRSRSGSRIMQSPEVITIEPAEVKSVSENGSSDSAPYKPKAPPTFARTKSPLLDSVKKGPVLQYTVPEVDASLVTTVTRTYDEHSLKERISRNCDRIEQLIRFVDQKCERRWWLKDLISFFQLFIKLALFVSASVSVVYHKEIIPSIVTLVIAVAQGVIELLDQYFVKNKQPDEVKLSVFTGTIQDSSNKKSAFF